MGTVLAHQILCTFVLLAPLCCQLAVAPALSQVQHKRAVFAMYRNAAVARDVADDGITAYGVATFGDTGHQVVDATDSDVCF